MKTLLALCACLTAALVTPAAEPGATSAEGRRLDYRIVITGGEMLHGVYPDAHTHFLTRTLHPLGVHCVGSMIVDDVREEMLDALRYATHDAALVIVTGGLGPTPNDITRDVLSEFTRIPLREQPDVVADMERRYKQRNQPLRANLRRQAEVPSRGGYLKSVNGTAVGLIFETDKAVIVALPGPPRELQAMAVNELVPYLRQRFGVRPLGASLTLRFVGVGQSQITQTIKEKVVVPAEVTITSLFEGGRVDFFFGLPANTPGAEATLKRLGEQIRGQLGEYLYADGTSSLEDAVLRKLQAANGTLALAEVCTGGQLEASLNNADGAARVLAGCFAAPTEETLARVVGAKSDQWSASSTAAERAKGLALAAAQHANSAWALAVGQPQAEADGGKWAWAALKLPDGHVVTHRLAARASDDAARAQMVTQLLDFLRRQLASSKP